MRMVSPANDPQAFRRIPANEVSAFIESLQREKYEKTEAQSILSKAREDAAKIAEESAELIKILEDRVEKQAEELAELQAKKFKAKQEAIAASTALSQLSAIVKDYTQLETWITQTIMSAVTSIIKDTPPDERWAGIIRKALDQTMQRWDLSVIANPRDFNTLNAIVSAGKFQDAIAQVQRDSSVPEGVCYLKSDSEFFELNLECQLSALEDHISQMLNQPRDEGF